MTAHFDRAIILLQLKKGKIDFPSDLKGDLEISKSPSFFAALQETDL